MKIIASIFFELKQGVREKAFWVVVFFFIFLLGVSLFLGELSLGDRGAVLRTVCLTSIELSALGLIIVRYTYNFYREKEFRLTDIYLSYSSAAHYIGGKLGGAIIVLFIYLFLSGLLGSLLLILNGAFKSTVFTGIYSIFLKLCFICSFVFLVCSLINSPLLSSFLVALIYLASELSYNALRLTSQSKYVFIKLVSKVLYYVLPNYHKVDLKIHAIYGVPISALYMVEITLYTCFYVILCYFVAVTIFERKDH